MKGSKRRSRPYVRTSTPLAPRREPAAGRLASSAGLARPSVEPLEARQLLFSLTITPDSGGTVRAFFGYAIPILQYPDEIDDVEAQDPTIEDFNENDGMGNPDVGPVPSGTVFQGSNLRLEHTIPFPASLRLAAPDAAEPNELALRVDPNGGDSITFRFQSGQGNNAPFYGVTNFQIDVAAGENSAVGLPIYNGVGQPVLTVRLLFQGEEVSSFSGAALEALNTNNMGQPGVGTFNFVPGQGAASPVFDAIRFEFDDNSDAFYVDNATFTPPQGRFTEFNEGRIYGAEIVFSGPVGSSVEVLDLYGRQMVQTIRLGSPQDLQNLTLIDLNDDGVPEFNDGIGQIIFSGTDETTRFSIVGGNIAAGDPDPNAAFSFNGFNFTRMTSITGLFTDFEASGFGFWIETTGNDIEIFGLPPGSGSVIVGSPFVRDNSSAQAYNPTGAAIGGNAVTNPADFNRVDQGIKVLDGANIGTVNVHGVLFGSSVFGGYVNNLWVGYLLGSASVDGDLGSLVVSTDAGSWSADADATDPQEAHSTGAELLVGRTVGEIAIGGRSVLNVTVGGDLNDPANKPPRDVLRYDEREVFAGAFGIDFANPTDDAIAAFAGAWARFAPAFGNGTFRNDSILSAEFVSNASTAVQIAGTLGEGDPINTAEDVADVFAFVADGTQPIVIESQGALPMYLRVMDENGRTLAANQLTVEELADFARVEFTPNAPGVYYLVVTGDPTFNADGNATTFINYVTTISGMAPVSFGAYRTGGSNGATAAAQDTNSVNLISGAMGSIRVGTGWVGPGGGESSPIPIINAGDDADPDTQMDFRGGSFSIASTLYNVTAGSDVGEGDLFQTVNIFVGGNLGSFITGISNVPGVNAFEGDLFQINLQVEGSIGVMDIGGGIGINQDVDDPIENPALGTPDSVNIATGLGGSGGDIGMIRAGSRVFGEALNIDAPASSTLGAFLIDQDSGIDPNGSEMAGIIGAGPDILSAGPGSDLRFADFSQIDQLQENQIIPLAQGTPVTLTDDGGAEVQISISGGDGNTNSFLRVLPIDQSEGVAIGQIVVDLSGGATLNITSLGSPDNTEVISIGRILVIGATQNPDINISGPGQIDVWLIQQLTGTALGTITNNTPNGDIVAIDVIGLDTLSILQGNLGRTEMPSWGPRLIGPYLGAAGGGGAVGGALPVNGAMDPNWNGQVYRPINDINRGAGNAYLDDIGAPLDPYLDGLVVRTGDLTLAQVSGIMGDVIVATGNLTELRADSDNSTPTGQFHGISGNIYANSIATINIGAGLQAPNQTPLPNVGIFANDDIGVIVNAGNPGASISGLVMAGNGDGDGANVGAEIDPDVDGLGRITLTDGSFVDAYVGAQRLDDFWISAMYGEDTQREQGNINELTTIGGDFFRSTLVVRALPLFRLTDGFFDASTIRAVDEVTTIEATGFRNTTLDGGDLEFRFNQIDIGQSLGSLRTIAPIGLPGEGPTVGIGDIIDLRLDVLGSVTGSITANNFTRVDIDVDNTIQLLMANNNIRASSITAGRLESAMATENIRTSTFSISGPIISLMADEITNTSIAVTGPDGRIETITATGLLSGSISASGPITTVRSTAGDIVATITTITSEGDVGRLEAARDLKIQTDISGTLDTLVAGRHIGDKANPSVILVRDDVQSVEAGGQLYSDLRIGGGLTGSVRTGPVVARLNNDQVGSGSIIAYERIELVEATGDFGGSVVSYSGGIGTVRIIDGSLRLGAMIAAYDGSVGLVEVLRGHLLGDVFADVDINTIRVVASADGVFGDIGINPNLSTGVSADALRNQLPPGSIPDSTIQGPTIVAGEQIRNIITTNGSVFEATIFATTFFANMQINGSVGNDNQTTGMGTVIASGNMLNNVVVTGSVSDTMFLAGVTDFGADGRPGGTGVNADTVKRGFIRNIDIGGDATNLVFSAGLKAGADGVYNTGDDLVEFGKSRVNTIQVGGTVTNATAYSDAFVNSGNNVSAGIGRAGTSRPVDDPQIAPGIPFNTLFSFSYAGGSGTIMFTDSGAAPLTGAYWNSSTGTITLVKTSKHAELVVSSSGGAFDSLDIITNDDASVGLVRVNANLTGDSDIVIDNKLRFLELQGFSGTGTIRAGGDILNFTSGNLLGGHVIAHYIRKMTINGDFGTPNANGEVRVDLQSVENIAVKGGFYGDMNISRYLGLFQPGSFTVDGLMRRGVLRVGESTGPISLGEMVESRISVNDTISSVTIAGDMFDSAIIAGGDIGEDAAYGGTGLDADRTTTGHIGTVDIAGDFVESDIVAGILRGPDGYFGTGDDTIAEGRSTIGTITIGGIAGGSNLGSESFRVAATGDIADIMANGADFNGIDNLDVELLDTQPLPIQVVDLRVRQESFIYIAEITFNQDMDASTIGGALSIAEVRGNGQVTITLDEAADYSIEYDDLTFTARVFFSQEITNRDLPQTGDQPGPGVYRFTLDPDVLRAQLVNARLDGDGNGFAVGNDVFSADDIVGDAGDKLVSETVVVTDELDNDTPIDFYGATDLDALLDDNSSFDGLPDPNRPFVLRGYIGDHPDNELGIFSFSSDVDLYKITLQAGQILRLGQMSGGAQFAARAVLDSTGEALMATTRNDLDDFLGFFVPNVPFADVPISQVASANLVQRGSVTPELLRLPNNPVTGSDLTTEDVFLVKETGTYYIAVTNTDQFGAGEVPNVASVPGGAGSYAFSIDIFDDGDSGFKAPTSAGNGTKVVNAPAPIGFAGPDGVFGTPDDATSLKLGTFTFGLDAGADGVLGTSDDVVTGTNGSGITSTWTDGGVLTTVIDSAIGDPNSAGVPNDVFADVDVYHLNNGGNIDPGTRFRMTVRLTDLGADLGSRTQDSLLDFTGNVQFAVFDTTGAGAVDDALLVLSPSDFAPSGRSPVTIADDGSTSYGYDDNGDFFVEFLTPGRVGADGLQAAQYAVYLQGAFNTDYQIEIVSDGAGQVQTFAQNILLELNGGTVDWLRAGGLQSAFGPYTTSVVGFTGSIENQDVDDYVIQRLISNLESSFAAAGVDVNISTNPTDFEFEDFSTVFLTRTNDPVNFFSAQFYGASEHADVLNADRNDEAVVYVPTLANLGLTPGEPGVDQFADSLTAAVGRRVGELLGLRTLGETAGAGGTVDIQASNSVEVFGTDLSYRFSTLDQALSNGYDTLADTDFFLGRQNSESLLDRILAP